MAAAKKIVEVWIAEAGPYEALSLGILMERGAVRRYVGLARATASRSSRAKFLYLAEEERQHGRVLADARKGVDKPGTMPKLPLSLSEVTGDVKAASPVDGVRAALRAEQESKRFYELCARRSKREAGRKMFEWLAEQETAHAAALAAESDLLRAQYTWSSAEGQIPVEEDFWQSKS